jgi:hypothetical protein
MDGPLFQSSFSFFLRCLQSIVHEWIAHLNCYCFWDDISGGTVAFLVNPFKDLINKETLDSSSAPVVNVSRVLKVLSERASPDILTFALHKANNNSVSWTSLGQRSFVDWSHSNPEEKSTHLVLASSPPVKNWKGSRFHGNFSDNSTNFKSTISFVSWRGWAQVYFENPRSAIWVGADGRNPTRPSSLSLQTRLCFECVSPP